MMGSSRHSPSFPPFTPEHSCPHSSSLLPSPRHYYPLTHSAVLLPGRGVDDLEVLDVVVRVGAEGELDAEALLHADKQVGVLAAQALEDRRMDQHPQRVHFPVLARMEAPDYG